MNPIKHLVVFDFDGTLFKSPRRPAKWRGKWWGNPVSLEEPLVPPIPGDSWWNDEICERAFEHLSDKECWVVMLTGRKELFSNRVNELLSQKGLGFPYVGLADEGGAAESKLAHIKGIIYDNPYINYITFYDDREEHLPIFKEFCNDNNLGCEIVHVPEAYTMTEGEQETQKRKLFVLIGPPGVGKSTWIRDNVEFSSSIIISRDAIVDKVAEENGLTYNDMWKNDPKIEELNKRISNVLQRDIEAAAKSEKDVIIDMTNMNVKTRKQWLNKFNRNKFTRVAVDFMIDKSNMEKLIKINKDRDEQLRIQGKSKKISRDVILSMLDRYEKPTEEEGFDRVTKINVDDRIGKISE